MGFTLQSFPHRAHFQTPRGSLLNHICFHGRNYNHKRLPYLCPCSWLDYGVLCALNAFQLLFEQILLTCQTTNISWNYLRQGQLTVKGKLAWLVFNYVRNPESVTGDNQPLNCCYLCTKVFVASTWHHFQTVLLVKVFLASTSALL